MSVISIQSQVAYGHVGNSAAVFPMQIPILSKQPSKVACPAASASSGSAIRRQTGAGNLRRSASIRNKRKLSNYHARVVPEFVWIRQRHHSQHFVTFSVDALSRRQNAIIPDCALKICFTTC